MSSWLILPPLLHLDGNVYGLLTGTNGCYFGGVARNSPARQQDVFDIDCEDAVAALKDPNTDRDVDPEYLWELVNPAMHENTNQKHDDEDLVGREEELVMGVSDGRHR